MTAFGRRRRCLVFCSLRLAIRCMEADWAVEIGADLPAIIVPWEGSIDLRKELWLAHQLTEAVASPILAQSLIKLNHHASPVFSSKCDLWSLSADEIDPLEFD